MLSHELAAVLRQIRNNDVVVSGSHRRIDGALYDPIIDTVIITLKPDENSIDDLALDEDERRFLAMHATYEAKKQDDFRYWDQDPERRVLLKARWLEIANAFHEDPWGTSE